MYCTHEAFHATGGFDERLFWGEEGAMGMALKREGRFVVIWERVLTSGRRFRVMSGLQILSKAACMALSPFTMFTRRSSVEKIWYDSNRENDDKMPNTLGVKASNGIALLILLVLLTGPLWEVLPFSLTPGTVRWVKSDLSSEHFFVMWD